MLSALFLVLTLTADPAPAPSNPAGIADKPFIQESHEAYPIGAEPGMNDVRAIAMDAEGNIWAATSAGLCVLKYGKHEWTWPMAKDLAGPAYALLMDIDGTIYAGTWNGVYQCTKATSKGIKPYAGTKGPITALCRGRDGIFAGGPDGFWQEKKGKLVPLDIVCARSVHAMKEDPRRGVWIATSNGLYCYTDSGTTLYQNEDFLLSCDVRDVAFSKDGALLAVGWGGINLFTSGKRLATITPEKGLPTADVRSITVGPDGSLWVGTGAGLAHFESPKWSVRAGSRWLINDEVRDVVIGPDGTAWVATAGGVSAIRRKEMTLSEKAAYFLGVCMERHVRAPWIVEKCRLPVPGDTSKWEPEDDDNDGGYTANYLAMEACRYAVTQDPGALANAKEAFKFLLYLEEVTGVPGYLARTVVPASWKRMHDGNRKYSEREIAEARVGDPRFKVVEERWHPTADGKWFWKGDTSSDEITAHFFGYLLYYDLAADEEEKGRIRELARRVMDYIIEGGFTLRDLDGTHTRWGVWSPEKLNTDPDWRAERGINSIELLSYLKATHHMTGDEKYQQAYTKLLNDERFKTNVREGKTYIQGWRTHIDDELLAFAFPALLLYEKDKELKKLYRESLDHWYEGVGVEQNAFANFIYGWLTGTDPHLSDSVFMLRDTPLDLVNWQVDNSKREDLVLQRKPIIDAIQTSRLLPPSERGVIRWDKNPWEAIQGDGGQTEWAPTFWLMPYWLGRYCGFIQAAK